MTHQEFVVLVDSHNVEWAAMEKMQAHKEGQLHRAISVFVLNSHGEILLQKRAEHKYHSPGLWSNTCCTHPYCDETAYDAAKRRLKQEMGLENFDLEELFHIIYKASLDHDLIEHEYDTLFLAYSDAIPVINHDEVSEYCYKPLATIEAELNEHPDRYTIWFKKIIPLLKNYLI